MVCASTLPHQAFADTPDDTYLHCGAYLVAFEATLEQRIWNYWEDGSDKVQVGIERMEPKRAAGFPELKRSGYVYPDKIKFDAGLRNYSVDRVQLTLNWTEKLDPSEYDILDPDAKDYEDISVPCTMISKTELQTVVDKHNDAAGGVKF